MSNLKERVEKAIGEIRGALVADGGDIQLIDIVDNVAKVKLKGACAGCPGAQMTLHMVVERKIKESVPEITKIEAVQ